MPEVIRLPGCAQQRHEVHAMIRVRMSEADKMQWSIVNDFENSGTRLLGDGCASTTPIPPPGKVTTIVSPRPDS